VLAADVCQDVVARVGSEELKMASAMIHGTRENNNAIDRLGVQGATHLPMRRVLLDVLAPLSGTRLLDMGCGVGLLLRDAAERGAWIAGVDIAPELLEVGHWALPDADLRVAPLDALPYDDGQFDAVTACNVLRYADDPVAVLGQAARVARPGGRIAIGDCGEPDGCLARLFDDRLGLVVPAPVDALDRPTDELLAAHLAALGLEVIGGGELDVPVIHPDLVTAWSAMVARGLVRAAIDAVGKAAVHDAFLEVYLPAVRADGSIPDRTVFRYVAAAKPV
jgi:SAM-dependent methyltransferase